MSFFPMDAVHNWLTIRSRFFSGETVETGGKVCEADEQRLTNGKNA